jgi:folate-binding protein YgfZ
MEADMNVYCLPDELLLDFEPGLEAKLSKRLEAFVVADDVQVVNVAPVYGLLSVQGPKAADVVRGLELFPKLPENEFEFQTRLDDALGEIYLVNLPRLRTCGFDLYVPVAAMSTLAGKLVAASKTAGGRICGWKAFELARVEAGVPRFGADMDETHFPQECGIEARAVSYSKGCYIGQEVLNRIHTIGHVNRQLCGLRLGEELRELPIRGDKLLLQDKEVGWVTTAIVSPVLKANVALGYVRRELNHAGTELVLHTAAGPSRAHVRYLPFC